jgi:hypothetical protein
MTEAALNCRSAPALIGFFEKEQLKRIIFQKIGPLARQGKAGRSIGGIMNCACADPPEYRGFSVRSCEFPEIWLLRLSRGGTMTPACEKRFQTPRPSKRASVLKLGQLNACKI